MSAVATATPPRASPAGEPGRPPARTRRIRPGAPVLLAALLAACAYAAFADGGVDLSHEAPLQIGLVVIALAALATGRAVPRAAPVAWAGVALLGAFAAWSALSLLWSVAPDLSWQSANRAAAYALVVVLALAAGTITPRAAERTALGLLALAVAVALWALLGKAFPGVVDGTALSPRLRDPLGYWNALALVCVIGMPPAIRVATDLTARPAARLGGLAALWLLIVTAALTYSRGGALALAAAVVVLVALGARRLPALAVLAIAAVAAVPPVALAFSRNALAYAAPLGDRIAAGRGLAAVLLVSLLALLGAGWAALRAEGRVAWHPAWSRAIWTALAGAAVLAVIVLLATGTVSRAVHDFGRTGQAPPISTPSRLLSTNSGNRWTWWREAAGSWSAKPLLGHGAGSFPVEHLQYRSNLLAVRQPHDVPLQFLAETGLIGALLGLGGIGALFWAAGAAVRRRPPASRERELGVALLAAATAWATHALVDWDWDIPGVTVPALVALGVIAAGAAPRARAARPRALVLAAAALAGWLSLVSVALPAVSDHKARAALRTAARTENPSALTAAAADADLAARLDPLAVEPRFAGAAIAAARGRLLEERSLLLDAVGREPSSAQGWLRLAEVGFSLGDADGANAAVRRALALDPLNPRTRALAANAVSNLAPPQDSPTATGTPLS